MLKHGAMVRAKRKTVLIVALLQILKEFDFLKVSSEAKAGELRFQPRTNLGMLHRGRLHARSGFLLAKNPSTTNSVPFHF